MAKQPRKPPRKAPPRIQRGGEPRPLADVSLDALVSALGDDEAEAAPEAADVESRGEGEHPGEVVDAGAQVGEVGEVGEVDEVGEAGESGEAEDAGSVPTPEAGRPDEAEEVEVAEPGAPDVRANADAAGESRAAGRDELEPASVAGDAAVGEDATGDEASGEALATRPPADDREADAEVEERRAAAAAAGVQLSDEIPLDPEDDLRDVQGEASPRLVSIVESLLFAAPRPLSVGDLRRLLQETSKQQIQLALKHLMAASAGRGVVVAQVAGGFTMRTHHENATWVQRLLQAKPTRLSRSQLETLAMVAYRQPVTRPEIDAIRGVDSGAVLKVLLERELVHIVGKKDEPGRPLLYGTTLRFLEFFNLRSLRDLPTLRDFRELSEESKATVRSRIGEVHAEALGQGVLGLDLGGGEAVPEDMTEGAGELSAPPAGDVASGDAAAADSGGDAPAVEAAPDVLDEAPTVESTPDVLDEAPAVESTPDVFDEEVSDEATPDEDPSVESTPSDLDEGAGAGASEIEARPGVPDEEPAAGVSDHDLVEDASADEAAEGPPSSDELADAGDSEDAGDDAASEDPGTPSLPDDGASEGPDAPGAPGDGDSATPDEDPADPE